MKEKLRSRHSERSEESLRCFALLNMTIGNVRQKKNEFSFFFFLLFFVYFTTHMASWCEKLEKKFKKVVKKEKNF